MKWKRGDKAKEWAEFDRLHVWSSIPSNRHLQARVLSQGSEELGGGEQVKWGKVSVGVLEERIVV